MNRKNGITSDQHATRERLAAELTLAAYAVVLRRERPALWLDLELDLWKALSETVERCERIRGSGGTSPLKPC
jgi:hypothetical protein